MPPAARIGDVSTHGGTVIGPGTPTVLIGGMPAAVAGDSHGCAIAPNVHQPTVSPFPLGSVTVLIGGLYALFPKPLLKLFTGEQEIVRLGTVYLWIFAASFVFLSLTIVMTRVFQGAGDTLWPTLVVAFRFGVFLAASVSVIAYTDWGAVGIWLALAVSQVSQTFALWIVYGKGTWKRKRLTSVEAWAA